MSSVISVQKFLIAHIYHLTNMRHHSFFPRQTGK